MNDEQLVSRIIELTSTVKIKKFEMFFNSSFKGLILILNLLELKNDSLSAGEIASLLKVSTARVAVAINTLEKKDLVKREKSKEDARKTIIKLTEKGKNICEENQKRIKNETLIFLQKLTNDEKIALISIINKLGN